jgi:CelD/BcsL family acetyltransferase involved in cellulose biosynthesis
MNTLHQLDLDDPAWTSFVEMDREATAFHEPAWAKLLAECYGDRGFALATLGADGRIVAGIPVIERNAALTRRRRWFSLPFTDHCSPLVSDVHTETQFAAQLEETRLGSDVDRIEVRSRLPLESGQRVTSAVRHTLALESDSDAVFRRLSKSQVQRNVPRARRAGVVVRRAERAEDLDHVFFDLQLETRRRLGVPIQPRRYYTLLWRRLLEPGRGFLLLAYHDSIPIGGAVFLRGNGALTYKYGASLKSHWPLRANALIFWTAIENACAEGLEIFDFGRTEHRHESLRTFKRNWGTEETPLTHTILGRRIPARSETPRLAAERVIRRSPTWVCRAIGESLYKYAS